MAACYLAAFGDEALDGADPYSAIARAKSAGWQRAPSGAPFQE